MTQRNDAATTTHANEVSAASVVRVTSASSGHQCGYVSHPGGTQRAGEDRARGVRQRGWLGLRRSQPSAVGNSLLPRRIVSRKRIEQWAIFDLCHPVQRVEPVLASPGVPPPHVAAPVPQPRRRTSPIGSQTRSGPPHRAARVKGGATSPGPHRWATTLRHRSPAPIGGRCRCESGLTCRRLAVPNMGARTMYSGGGNRCRRHSPESNGSCAGTGCSRQSSRSPLGNKVVRPSRCRDLGPDSPPELGRTASLARPRRRGSFVNTPATCKSE